MKKITTLIICFLALSFCAAEIFPSIPAIAGDYRDIHYPETLAALPLKNWQLTTAENPDAPDAKWHPVEVNSALFGQNIDATWCWYRAQVDLPENWNNKPVLFDLGRVSAYDEVFINGVKRASYGTPPPNLVFGCSYVYREYLIAPGAFKPGRNTISIRVFVGVHGGLYEGSCVLKLLPNDGICSRMNLKNGGTDSLKTLLTEAEHLNRFAAGSEIVIAPELHSIAIAQNQKLTVNLNGSEQSVDLPLQPGMWTKTLFRFKAPVQPGKYRCTLNYGEQWRKNIEFTVINPGEKMVFQIPIDETLRGTGALPTAITPGPMGRFSIREYSPRNGFADNLKLTDSRGGMGYTAQISYSIGAPRLLLANVRPVPENANKTGRFHRAGGHQYDGFNDAWIYGCIRPNRAGKLQSLDLLDSSWVERTYRWKYAEAALDFTVSAISPAWRAESDCLKLRIFEDIGRFGIGLPHRLAYQDQNGAIRVVDAGTGVSGKNMGANWILAWFNESQNWDGFDMPYLLVFEKRPAAVKNHAGAALFVENPDGVGLLQGMPLYGVELKTPETTAKWKNGLPADVRERCRFWSRVLAAPPIGVQRSAKIDYENDTLTVRDQFQYRMIQDAWNTEPLKIAPLSTVIPLAVASGNMKIAAAPAVTDLQMATLHGPLMAANGDTITVCLKNLLHFVREVRKPRLAQPDPEITDLVQLQLKTGLQSQFMKSIIHSAQLIPGVFRLDYTNLLLLRPYLQPETRAKLDAEIQSFSEKYLLYDAVPDAVLSPLMRRPSLRALPTPIRVTNPVTGLRFAFPSIDWNTFGIDSVYFSTLNIYMAWLYAHTYGKHEWLDTKYPLLLDYFNNARNSHDWATGVSWDTFGGLRVGNGLQESGGIHAGCVAMARIARGRGESDTSNIAAYHAAMQLVGIQAVLNATDFLREYRPFHAEHSCLADMEYVQKTRPFYLAEINEFGGFFQKIIGLIPGGGPTGYIESPLPEVMRPYHEIWRDFTDDFYSEKYDVVYRRNFLSNPRVTLDYYLYQTERTPAQLQEIAKFRAGVHRNWWNRTTDRRALLDSQKPTEYQRLW